MTENTTPAVASNTTVENTPVNVESPKTERKKKSSVELYQRNLDTVIAKTESVLEGIDQAYEPAVLKQFKQFIKLGKEVRAIELPEELEIAGPAPRTGLAVGDSVVFKEKAQTSFDGLINPEDLAQPAQIVKINGMRCLVQFASGATQKTALNQLNLAA